MNRIAWILSISFLLCPVFLGCGPSATAPVDPTATEVIDAEKAYVFEAPIYEATADALLDARLPIEETTEGWIRLFDGHTMFGWTLAGEANFAIADQTLTVDRGGTCLCATSTQWSDFELKLDFKADAATNSGVFIRTPLEPRDPAIDCFEINIAPSENPFPTGGIVGRQKADPLDISAGQWHSMTLLADRATITVSIDGQVVNVLETADSPRSGHIGLQHNEGAVAFRNVRLRPIGLVSLLDPKMEQWKRTPGMSGTVAMTDEGLKIDGGKQQLESDQTYADFTLLTDVRMDDARSNSGIFFRAIPGDVMMGYECQVSNEMKNDNPMSPTDCGIGGIFKRQDARVVAGEPGRFNSILLVARGNHFATWVNGLQVVDVTDDRPVHENPRNGLRLDPGSIMLQGHDPTTQAVYRKIAIASGS